eukprot:GHVR01024668.1.p1 GENE.GHVR01024668.1~~GHVR01024668.1.p1  ORF type:complete len:258 (-),score=91.21 GHVR01024668.1:41-814(-)
MSMLGRNLYQDNEHWDLVDALPYVDALTPEQTFQVQKLLDLEMQRLPKRDYLERLPLPDTPLLNGDHPFFHKEIQRISGGVSLSPLDVSRYEAPAPSGVSAGDLSSWKEAVLSAQCSLEYSSHRESNLFLSHKYCEASWLRHCSDLEANCKRVTSLAQSTKTNLDNIHKKRKLEQLSSGNSLKALQKETTAIQESSSVLIDVLGELSMDVKSLKEECSDRGILPPELQENETCVTLRETHTHTHTHTDDTDDTHMDT